MATKKTWNQIFDPWQRESPYSPMPYSVNCLDGVCHHSLPRCPYTAYSKHDFLLFERQKNVLCAAARIAYKKWLTGSSQDLIHQLCTYLASHGWADAKIDTRDVSMHVGELSRCYLWLAYHISPCKKAAYRTQFLEFFAQELFWYCFEGPHAHTFIKRLNHESFHPIARFFYSIIWTYIGHNHWPTWHKKCLQGLQEAQKKSGKPITYLAGGTDIYLPLSYGIDSITIIDPLLPTQYRYYSRGWRFLVGGRKDDKKNDTIAGKCGSLDISMKRLKQPGAHAKHKISSWGVYTKENSHEGRITFDRRFIQTNDLCDQTALYLVSYNELYFIASQERGWEIDVEKLPQNTLYYIKQCARPVTRRAIEHIRAADKSIFQFIQLGSSVT